MTADLRLAGKVALVTGAGRGLGRALAGALADAGADVALVARTASQVEAAAEDLRGRGRRAVSLVADVSDAEQVEDMVAGAVDHLGRIDVLVNNAGILHVATVTDTPVEAWDRVLAVNLRGAFLCTKVVGNLLIAQSSGKVVNVASNFGLTGVPGFAAYSASKAALIQFTRVVALEWARHNVQVNALAPGYFETDFNAEAREDEATVERILRQVPARRMGKPEELGAWAVLLASAASDYMTGETIVIDGGQVAG